MVGTETPNVVGVVLAGGASIRMGRDKALVEVAGKPMLAWVIGALEAVTPRIVIAGPERAGWEHHAFVTDPGTPHRGPLAGITTAMAHVDRDALLIVVGVDQPWIRQATLSSIAARFTQRPVVPVPDGVRQTTCAAYPANLDLVATRELNGGGSIQSMLDRTAFDPFTEADMAMCGEDGRSWFSVNTADDLAEGLVLYGEPSSDSMMDS
jgi:molybdopterin-guanine dinucleotide biosynthesis protein A